MSLLIYTKEISNRKKYVFGHLFKEVLGLDFLITNNTEQFIDYTGPKISYGEEPIADEIFFKRHHFLLNKGVEEVVLNMVSYKTYKVPFAVDKSFFPFDVFSATFYLLSRYEEYLIEERDNHERFLAKNSLAYQNNFLKKPVIDEWAYEIHNALEQRFHFINKEEKKFNFIPTLDVDMPYYLKAQHPVRKVLKSAKLLMKGKVSAVFKDIYDTYNFVLDLDEKYGFKTKYFFLMGDKHQFDATHQTYHPTFKKLIKELKLNHSIGIHPSYSSNYNKQELTEEIEDLSRIVNADIEISRQHYLKMSLPYTYQNLLENNVKKDFTMLYADEIGFRASTCTPFYWYDLESDNFTELKVYPCALMDQTLRSYKALSPAEAIKEIELLLTNVKAVNGTFVSLWHNESLSNFGVWNGWQDVYIRMLETAALN